MPVFCYEWKYSYNNHSEKMGHRKDRFLAKLVGQDTGIRRNQNKYGNPHK